MLIYLPYHELSDEEIERSPTIFSCKGTFEDYGICDPQFDSHEDLSGQDSWGCSSGDVFLELPPQCGTAPENPLLVISQKDSGLVELFFELQRDNIPSFLARNYHEAREIIRRNTLDLILSDVGLPTGYEISFPCFEPPPNKRWPEGTETQMFVPEGKDVSYPYGTPIDPTGNPVRSLAIELHIGEYLQKMDEWRRTRQSDSNDEGKPKLKVLRYAYYTDKTWWGVDEPTATTAKSESVEESQPSSRICETTSPPLIPAAKTPLPPYVKQEPVSVPVPRKRPIGRG